GRAGVSHAISGRRNGTPSSASVPRPIASIAATMRPSRRSIASANRTMRMFGVAGREGPPSAQAIPRSSRARSGAPTHPEDGRGGAADPGPAMHHQGCGTVPGAHECEQVRDMLLVGRDVTFERLADVVHAQEEMVVGRYGRGAFDEVVGAEQGHYVARPGLLD